MAPSTVAFRPADTHLLEFSGPDAQDFLHRLTTVDFRDFPAGESRLGFFLTPQGRIRAWFRAHARAAGDYRLEVEGGRDDHWRKELLAVIDQFTFAEKYALKERTDLACLWLLGDESDGADLAGALVLDHGAADFGLRWRSVWAAPAEIAKLASARPAIDAAAVERRGILALRPAPDRELVPEANPLELGLRRAIADQKGCYPGQEVIEKIISLGAPARRLALFRADGARAPATPSPIRDPAGAEIGALTAAFSDGSATWALGFVRKTHAKEGVEAKFDGVDSIARLHRLSAYE